MGLHLGRTEESQPFLKENAHENSESTAIMKENELILERILINQVDSTLEAYVNNQFTSDSTALFREAFEEDSVFPSPDHSDDETEPEIEPSNNEDEPPLELNRRIPRFFSEE